MPRPGITMGKLVDRLVADGGNDRSRARDLAADPASAVTPNGFVCRKVRKPNHNGAAETRTYEFVLIPWSPARDAQLELDLGEDAASRDAGEFQR